MTRPQIDIASEPCACPPGVCANFGCATTCVHRLVGDVRTQICPVCAPAHTWHQDGACLRCRALVAAVELPCACEFCRLGAPSHAKDGANDGA